MALAVDVAYENEVDLASEKQAQTRTLGEECYFVSSGLRSNDADTEILGCAEGFVCEEHSHSSLGGFCVSPYMKQRGLTSCTTKCTGDLACEGLSNDFINNKIADGACCGFKACSGVDEGENFLFAVSYFMSIPHVDLFNFFCVIVIQELSLLVQVAASGIMLVGMLRVLLVQVAASGILLVGMLRVRSTILFQNCPFVLT